MKLTQLILGAFFVFIAYPAYSIPIPVLDTKSHQPFLVEIYDCAKLQLVSGSDPSISQAILVSRNSITDDNLIVWRVIKYAAIEAGRFYQFEIHEESDCVK